VKRAANHPACFVHLDINAKWRHTPRVSAPEIQIRERPASRDCHLAPAKHRAPCSGRLHSEKALAPALARAFFDRLPGPRKELHWLSSQGQIDFYDDPVLIEPAVDLVVRAFAVT
jgi:hypothetical protein